MAYSEEQNSAWLKDDWHREYQAIKRETMLAPDDEIEEMLQYAGYPLPTEYESDHDSDDYTDDEDYRHLGYDWGDIFQ